MNVPVVELVDLCRTYPGPAPVEAVRPVSLLIRSGEYVILTGPSGSGKSTLLHLLSMLDRATAGTYRLDGVDTTALSDAERTALRGRRIGFVFQAFHLLPHRTALENVMLGLMYSGRPRTERRRLASAAITSLGLAHRAHALPTTLSGGERQRVAIARAVATEPAVLLADEPTGNLDSATSESVLTAFDDLHGKGYTLVVATHDPQVAERGTRQLVMRDGALVRDSGGPSR